MAKYRVIVDIDMSSQSSLKQAQLVVSDMLRVTQFQGDIQYFDIIDVDQVGE